MSAIVRMEKTFNCLINFRDNCNNEEYKKLIDIFLPMFYRKNKNHLEISVGKRMSKTKFYSALSMLTTNFIVKLSDFNNEPRFIISDATAHDKVITIINLKLVKDLHIESEEDEVINFYRHNICFNYNNEIDYHIHIALTK